MSKRCFICSGSGADTGDYHSSCLKSFFNSDTVPEVPFGLDELNKLGEELVAGRVTVPGVQKKLSLHLSKDSGSTKLTFVGVLGDYILKPPVETYAELPENEHLTMTLAGLVGIQTVPHALIRMKSGEAAYITKRIDRIAGGKIHMEDCCQLSEKMTEDKYRGSYEQVGKIIRTHCNNRMLDILRFYETVLFSWLSGNGDMHLKNFSLIEADNNIALAPAYDLINTRLVITEKDDPDETALALCGKRRRLQQNDFIRFGESLGLNRKQIANVFKRFRGRYDELVQVIDNSFLNENLKMKYAEIFRSRFEKIM